MADTASSPTTPKARKDLLPNEHEVNFQRWHEFFNRNKPFIAGAVFIVLLVAIGYTALTFQENKTRNESWIRLAEATTPDALATVAQAYPGTEAGLFAALLTADQQFERSQWDKATATYQTIIERHPRSFLVPSAVLGQAAILEATGKIEEALKRYQAVLTDFPSSLQAPQACYLKAALLENTGKLTEAKQAYEDLKTTFPDSAWTQAASMHLQKLSSQLKAAKPSTPATPPTPPKV